LHLATGDQLSALVDRAVRPLGLTAVVLAVDLAQGALTPVQPQPGSPVMVEGTVADRAYQNGQIIPSSENGARTLWVPILDGRCPTASDCGGCAAGKRCHRRLN
jgi:hypothetical protein